MLHCHLHETRQFLFHEVFLFYAVYKEIFLLSQQVSKHYEILLGYTIMFSKLAVSYISPVSVPLVLFLLYVLRFGYLFASLLYGGNLHLSSLEPYLNTNI